VKFDNKFNGPTSPMSKKYRHGRSTRFVNHAKREKKRGKCVKLKQIGEIKNCD
jgi:hypothetical protein